MTRLAAVALLAVFMLALPASVLVVGQMAEAHAALYRPVVGVVPACPAVRP